MNREIKFRGKRVDNGEWVFGHLLARDIDTGNVYIREMNSENVPPRYCDYLVDAETVGQFTGLTDMYLHDVYEGDRLKFADGDTAIVLWNKSEWALVFPNKALASNLGNWGLGSARLFGNIHEPVNPGVDE